MSPNMSSGHPPETENGKEPEPELQPQSTLAPSSTSTLVSTSAIEEPREPNNSHKALSRAFNIWPIYDNIYSHLAVADQAALALTCSSLRKSLYGVADVRTLRSRLSRPEFLDVLWTVARNLPDHYVCEQCMYLHRVDSAQTGHAFDVSLVQQACEDFVKGKLASSPMPDLEPPCRLPLLLNPLYASYPPPPPKFDADLSSMTFMNRFSLTRRTPLSGLAHRDVQLLLKHCYCLDRPMTIKYKFVPRMVLGDHDCGSYSPTGGGQINGQGQGPGRGRRPRFLFQTEISVDSLDYPIVSLAICPHQTIKAFDDLWLALPLPLPLVPPLVPTPEDVQQVLPPFPLQTAADCVVKARKLHDDYYFGRTSTPPRHVRVLSSSCDRCPTDFAVRMASDPIKRPLNNKLISTVWQDFGAEAPVTGQIWQSHIPGPFLQDELENAQAPFTEPNTWHSGPTVTHSPGSVRVLFEKGEPA